MEWTDGYITEVSYTPGYYRELSPAHINLALILNQYEPITQPIRYLELGYGQGLSLNIHAATVPGEYWGTDFNPNHAANASSLATASGATVQALDDSFAELAKRDDLPEFDVIALHGIWSWISPENRQIIVDILRRKLRVGGVVYLSYNAMPGWATMSPVRNLLKLHAQLASPASKTMQSRIEDAIDFGRSLAECKARYFTSTGLGSDTITSLSKKDYRYVAHEYLNSDFYPMYFHDIAKLLDSAKLTYVASANMIDYVDSINLTPEQLAIIKAMGDPIMAETVRDYCVNQRFRRDLWVKGRKRISRTQQQDRLADLTLTWLSPASSLPKSIVGSRGTAELQVDIYQPVFEWLQKDQCTPKRYGDFAEHCPTVPLRAATEVLTLLSGSGHVAVAQSPDQVAQGRTTAARLNAALIDRVIAGGETTQTLASPVAGLGVPVPLLQQLFLHSLQLGHNDPKTWATRASAVLARHNHVVQRNGQTLPPGPSTTSELTEQAMVFAKERLPALRSLGIA